MRGDVLRKHPPHAPPKPFYKINNKNPPTKENKGFPCTLVGGFLLLILQRGLGGVRGGYFLKIPSPVYYVTILYWCHRSVFNEKVQEMGKWSEGNLPR